MGIIRVHTADGGCYEQKGYWAWPNGEREWHATSGAYPCGTWSFRLGGRKPVKPSALLAGKKEKSLRNGDENIVSVEELKGAFQGKDVTLWLLIALLAYFVYTIGFKK